MVMGEFATSTEVLVIGAGPGGYVAALRAAQLGKQVTLVDKSDVGGICLTVGCIPSKALIHAANLAEKMRHADQLGIGCGAVRVNINKLRSWKEQVVTTLTAGIRGLLAQRGVTLIAGEARFESSQKARVTTALGNHLIAFTHAIIATGSSPVELPDFAFDGKSVWSSDDAIRIPSLPKRLCIIGGGYIGLELGGVYQKLGSQVTVVQKGESLLPSVPAEAVRVVQRNMEELGVKFLLDTSATGLKKGKDLTISLEHHGKKTNLSCDAVLVAVGRRPNTRGLSLENSAVKVDEKGFITVDEHMQSTDPSIYAIGDVAGEPMLAHKASRQGHVAAEVICGQSSAFDNICVPEVIFTDPEIALVGMMEDEAPKAGRDVKTGMFPLSASGRALTTHSTEGFIKLVTDAKNGLVLGGLIVGSHASDLISEIALAIEMGATAEDLLLTIHPHPTFGEAVMEAAADALGQAIHLSRRPLAKTEPITNNSKSFAQKNSLKKVYKKKT